MQVIRSMRKMQAAARKAVTEGKTIGLVPTMGYLHDGHLSLITRARKRADLIVVSIFVNPTQFAPGEDLGRYPRDEKGDLRKIRVAGGDIVFIPKADAVYPAGFQTYVTVENLTTVLEGASRPTHFRGVTTVVAKLFNVVRPDVAVFGMKDFQQATVLRRMTGDLGYPVKIIVAPTVREKSGLAMSSRNAYFTPDQRAEALCLYYALRRARAMVRAGEVSAARVRREMKAVIRATCPTAAIDYIAFSDIDSLRDMKTISGRTVCSLAVRVHGVRLIDNMKMR